MHSLRIRSSLSPFKAQQRLLSSTSACFSQGRGDPSISQGHVTEPNQRHAQDTQSQSARAGFQARTKPGGPSALFDAANAGVADAERPGEGEHGEMGKEEDAKAPGVFPWLKQALGFGTTTDEVKQNRGGGQGVTGTGSRSARRGLHTSAILNLGVDETHDGPSEVLGQPKEETHGNWNDDPKHEKSRGENGQGDENAGEATARQIDAKGHDTAHGGSGYGGESAERFDA